MNDKEEPAEINTPDVGFTEAFISHAFTPRNVGTLPAPDGYGAPKGVCGDTIEIFLKVKDERVERALFMTDGCAHTVACASVVTELVVGRDVRDALAVTPEEVIEGLGGLPRNHVHCARLAVTTLKLAVKNYFKNRGQPWKKLYHTGR